MDDVFALLRLQVDWGADEAIDLEPLDRLQPVQAPRLPPPKPVAVVLAGMQTGTPAQRAQDVAARASTLEELRAAMAAFDGCPLRDTASHLVFAEGDPTSTTLIIGEPPGRDEDRSGHPFAGSEGQFLDDMLMSIGLTRAELMLVPLLPWRPPGGRPPSPTEITICLPFLHRLIVLLRPRRMVLLGGSVARALLPTPANRRRNPRTWLDASIPGTSDALPALVLPGLADMQKKPLLKRDAWAALRLLRRALDTTQTQS